jgi:hypothetical protein
MTFNEVIAKIDVRFKHLGFDPARKQAHFQGIVNGYSFDYWMGLGLYNHERLTKLKEHLAKHNPKSFAILENISSIRSIVNTPIDEKTIDIWRALSNCIMPDKYGFLDSLKLDCAGLVDTFKEWAEDYGEDSNSIKALETFQKIQQEAKDLRQALGDELYNQLMEAEFE